mmetsp:Transcript_4552/g.7893  ORF Transcript_4552/g.7893 Transcript_4552/m.7893 type:complete len:209 (+) Transcript_4552:5336-5962(+)
MTSRLPSPGPVFSVGSPEGVSSSKDMSRESSSLSTSQPSEFERSTAGRGSSRVMSTGALSTVGGWLSSSPSSTATGGSELVWNGSCFARSGKSFVETPKLPKKSDPLAKSSLGLGTVADITDSALFSATFPPPERSIICVVSSSVPLSKTSLSSSPSSTPIASSICFSRLSLRSVTLARTSPNPPHPAPPLQLIFTGPINQPSTQLPQ